jgi:putative NIF3 family GTP cyclohydrolase 1 type 2
VVWRFHDHWHERRPDGILTGMVEALGWGKYRSPGDPRLFVVPETTLDRFAGAIKERLGIRTLRVVGDPAMRLSKVALNPGYCPIAVGGRMLGRDDVEVLVMGESPEWETVEYADDAVAQGRRKALIILGHIPSEQAGMDECARWLKTFVTEVPVEFVPASEPFWTPG